MRIEFFNNCNNNVSTRDIVHIISHLSDAIENCKSYMLLTISSIEKTPDREFPNNFDFVVLASVLNERKKITTKYRLKYHRDIHWCCSGTSNPEVLEVIDYKLNRKTNV